MGQSAQVCQTETCQIECTIEAFDSDPCSAIDHFSEAPEPKAVRSNGSNLSNGQFGRIDAANCSLIRASMENDVQGIKQALSDGADINARMPMLLRMLSTVSNDEQSRTCRGEPSGLTALMHAATEGHADAVKFLVSSRATVHLQETDGMQAIHFAAQAECAKCFRALLDARADPLAKDDYDQDALQYVPLETICRSASRIEWLALLKEAGGMELFASTNSAPKEMDGHDIALLDMDDLQGAETAIAKEMDGHDIALLDMDDVQGAETAIVKEAHAGEVAIVNLDEVEAAAQVIDEVEAAEQATVMDADGHRSAKADVDRLAAADIHGCANEYGEDNHRSAKADIDDVAAVNTHSCADACGEASIAPIRAEEQNTNGQGNSIPSCGDLLEF